MFKRTTRAQPLRTLLVASGAILLTSAAVAQLLIEPSDSSVLFKLQGNRFERRAYDADGDLEGRQIITFDWLMYQGHDCLLPVSLEVFEEPDFSNLGEAYEITISVECAEPHLVASVLAFGGDPGSRDLEVQVVGEGEIYPPILKDGQDLPDLRFVVSLRRGFLSLLGTRSEMLVTNRLVKYPPPVPGLKAGGELYEIHSHLEVELYMVGLRWKRESFTNLQVLQHGRGLLAEISTRDDGSRAEIRVISHDSR